MFRGVVRDTTVRVFGHESWAGRMVARAASWISRRVNPAIHATAPRHPLPQNGALGEVIPTARPTKENPDLYGVEPSSRRCQILLLLDPKPVVGSPCAGPWRQFKYPDGRDGLAFCLRESGHMGAHRYRRESWCASLGPGQVSYDQSSNMLVCWEARGHTGEHIFVVRGGENDPEYAAEAVKRREATPRRCGMAGGRGRCVYAEGHGGAHSMGFYQAAQ